MPFIFIYKDRYKIIISYLCGFLISRPNNAFGRRTFPVSWNKVFVFCSLKKKNKMLSWALFHLSFFFRPFSAPVLPFYLPLCLDASPPLCSPLCSPLLLFWPLPARPGLLSFLCWLCCLSAASHPSFIRPWASVELRSPQLVKLVWMSRRSLKKKHSLVSSHENQWVENSQFSSGISLKYLIERRRDGQIEVGIRIPGLNSTSESKDPDFWGSSLFLAIWATTTLTVILGCSVPNPVFHPPLF